MKPLVITICTFLLALIAISALWGASSIASIANPPEWDSYLCVFVHDGPHEPPSQTLTVPKGAPAPTCPPNFLIVWTGP